MTSEWPQVRLLPIVLLVWLTMAELIYVKRRNPYAALG